MSHHDNYFKDCKSINQEIRLNPGVLDIDDLSRAFVTDKNSQGFSYNRNLNTTLPTGQNDLTFCHNVHEHNTKNIRQSLEKWLEGLSDPAYYPGWNDEEVFDGIDPIHRQVDIHLHWFESCPSLNYGIYNHRDKLLHEGTMNEGSIHISLGENDSLQDWNGQLKLYIGRRPARDDAIDGMSFDYQQIQTKHQAWSLKSF